MRCPFCSTEETKVIDSRLVSDGYQRCVVVGNAGIVMNALPPLKRPN